MSAFPNETAPRRRAMPSGRKWKEKEITEAGFGHSPSPIYITSEDIFLWSRRRDYSGTLRYDKERGEKRLWIQKNERLVGTMTLLGVAETQGGMPITICKIDSHSKSTDSFLCECRFSHQVIDDIFRSGESNIVTELPPDDFIVYQPDPYLPTGLDYTRCFSIEVLRETKFHKGFDVPYQEGLLKISYKVVVPFRRPIDLDDYAFSICFKLSYGTWQRWLDRFEK